MSVRLNVSIDDALYARLKKQVPSKKRSAFIIGAIRAKLHLDARVLNDAYRAARKERWRKDLQTEWKHVDDERWPRGTGHH